LADAAGYSVRWVAKAESGAPISLNSIAVLARTLSTEAEPVSPSDLLRTTVEIAQEFVAIMYRHEAETLQQALHIVAPDAHFVVWGESAGLPFAGTYRGVEEGERLFRHFFSLIEAPPDHDPLPHYQFFTQGDDVLAVGHSHLRPRNFPAQVPLPPPMPISYLFRFRENQIVYFEDRFDTAHGGQLLGTLAPPTAAAPPPTAAAPSPTAAPTPPTAAAAPPAPGQAPQKRPESGPHKWPEFANKKPEDQVQ
jgi:hypothetical protein